MTPPTRVGLVGCASRKLAHPAPARDLYTTSLFRKASAYAEATCDRWYVLSAKHGLIHPDAVIEPYDVVLGRKHWDPTRDAPPIHDWSARVRAQLTEALADVESPELVLLAGSVYGTFLYGTEWCVTKPLEGMGIGQRLAWLTRENIDLPAAK